jgi:glyoxylate reductase
MLLGRDLADATLGIVGLGAIGQAVAARANPFGMRVVGWSRSERAVPGVEPVPFETLLQTSDFVSVHVALTPETRHLFGAETFARMKQGAVLINTSRGEVIDEAALCRALASGRIGAAGLDVFEQEPLAADSPLLAFDQVVVAPHIGSASVATRRRMVDLAIDNLLAGLAERPLPHAAA